MTEKNPQKPENKEPKKTTHWTKIVLEFVTWFIIGAVAVTFLKGLF